MDCRGTAAGDPAAVSSHMPHLPPHGVLVLALVATATAQSVVLPAGADTTPPNVTTPSPTYSAFVFYSDLDPRDSHTQLVYPTSDVGQASAVWSSLGVRRPAYLATANPAITVTAKIVMSVSPLAYDEVTGTFATNHGPAPVTVHAGLLSLPARTQPAAWPAPWEVIAFATPFPFQRVNGRSLVVDIHQSRIAPGLAWHVEVSQPGIGARQDNLPSWPPTCRFSNGQTNSFLTYQMPSVGSSWTLSYQPLPLNRVAIGVLGTPGIGGTWAGLRLPIDLAPLGAPSCTWNVSVDVTVPLVGSGPLYSWELRLPSDPAIAGRTFYEQAVLVDPGANALGLATTWSSKWTVGAHPGVRASFIDLLGILSSNPTGRFHGRTGVTIQLNP